MINKFKKSNINYVFIISLILTGAVAAFGIFTPDLFETAAKYMYDVVIQRFGWFYVVLMLGLVICALYLACSKYGNIKLGKEDDKPEFNNITWFSMLFGAGMGIGLIFYGAAEPLQHFVYPYGGIEPGTTEATRFALQQSFIHYAIHPWAAYSVIGLALAYFQFRKGAPGLISSLFLPVLGEKGIRGPIGKAIDILAVFTTVTGVTTALGLGTMQIAGGFEYMFGIENTISLQVMIICVAGILYTISSSTGLEKGIKMLSNINLGLAAILLFTVILIGPKLAMLSNLVLGTTAYFSEFISQSLFMDPSREWVGAWRVFYFAYWVAWLPFVGVFVARISRGRTIREFVIGVTVAPSIAGIVWFTVFGTLGMDLGLEFATGAAAVIETTLFDVLANYPLGYILSILSMVLLCTFFIASADSATYVLGMFTSDGDLDPSTGKKVTWGVIQALFGIALLLSGGLETLQAVSIISSAPFAIVLVFGIMSLFKSLREDFKEEIERDFKEEIEDIAS